MWIQQSSQQGCVVLTLAGRLDLAAASQVQRAILKHLAEQPPAIICDLGQVAAIDPLCAGVFTSIRHPALSWPGTTLLLAAIRPDLRAGALWTMSSAPKPGTDTPPGRRYQQQLARTLPVAGNMAITLPVIGPAASVFAIGSVALGRQGSGAFLAFLVAALLSGCLAVPVGTGQPAPAARPGPAVPHAPVAMPPLVAVAGVTVTVLLQTSRDLAIVAGILSSHSSASGTLATRTSSSERVCGGRP
jgi:anti-anti-sigma regulatory factor